MRKLIFALVMTLCLLSTFTIGASAHTARATSTTHISIASAVPAAQKPCQWGGRNYYNHNAYSVAYAAEASCTNKYYYIQAVNELHVSTDGGKTFPFYGNAVATCSNCTQTPYVEKTYQGTASQYAYSKWYIIACYSANDCFTAYTNNTPETNLGNPRS